MVKEGTQNTEGKDSEIIENWLRTEKAPEPGTASFDGIIKDPELPPGVGMKFNTLVSAGWVYVYHSETGDKSRINKNMLRTQLQKRLPSGKYAFSLYPPKDKDGNIIKPMMGIIKCLLHQDNPNRASYNQMGFGVCPKENLPSQHALIQHMEHRHSTEYKAIEKVRIDAEKAEERAFQKTLYNRITNNEPQPVRQTENQIEKQTEKQQAAPLYVSEKDKQKR